MIVFQARAYPAQAGDPAISYVYFTGKPAGRDWQILCPARSPDPGTDRYACVADLRTLGVPDGPLTVSFDVYDVSHVDGMPGGYTKAPHGLRQGTVAMGGGDSYAFLANLILPWCQGDSIGVSQDWKCHWSTGFALDFAGARGIEVLAPATGTIRVNPYSLSAPTYGEHVAIDVGSGWEMILAHLDRVDSWWTTHSSVLQGEIIGALGDSGIRGNPDYCPVACPHIHFELRLNGAFPTRLRDENLPLFVGHKRNDFDCQTACNDRRCFAASVDSTYSCVG